MFRSVKTEIVQVEKMIDTYSVSELKAVLNGIDRTWAILYLRRPTRFHFQAWDVGYLEVMGFERLLSAEAKSMPNWGANSPKSLNRHISKHRPDIDTLPWSEM